MRNAFVAEMSFKIKGSYTGLEKSDCSQRETARENKTAPQGATNSFAVSANCPSGWV